MTDALIVVGVCVLVALPVLVFFEWCDRAALRQQRIAEERSAAISRELEQRRLEEKWLKP